MKILLACEYSNTVSKEFRKLGHTVISCDLLPNDEDNTNHYQGDVFDIINDGFDMMIAHPPCTYLTIAGNGWFNEDKYGNAAKQRKIKRLEALEFFKKLWDAPIEKICIENPLGYINTNFLKESQTIHPYYFGDSELKRTCLWLKNLPKLISIPEDDLFNLKTYCNKPTYDFIDRSNKKRYFTDRLAPSRDRWKIRSKTFPGIARAMANQWG